MTDGPAYGLWSLVVINSLVFIISAVGSLSQGRLVIGGFSARSPRSSSLSSWRCTVSRRQFICFRVGGWAGIRERTCSHTTQVICGIRLLGWKVNPQPTTAYFKQRLYSLRLHSTFRGVENAL
jgi:hypothetical protein